MAKKTSTERTRQFRARQKLKQIQNGIITRRVGRPRGTRTAADRSRDYRKRLKEKHGFIVEDECYIDESIMNGL